MSNGRREFNLFEYFTRELQKAEEALRYAETSGFRLIEHTAAGGKRDITQQHIDQLRQSRDEYARVLGSLK